MRKVTLIFLLTLIVTSSHAVTIAGGSDCGEWFQTPTAKQWLLGYLSGVNASGVLQGKDFLKNTSAPQLFLWMDNHCKANPLKTVQEAANALAMELNKKANP